MGQKSGFFTSSSGDRKYGSDWLAQYIAAIISNGVYTTELTVSGDNGNMSVTVGPGRAWINGYMYSNDSNMTLALSAADGALSRTDLVVLRLDMTNRQITLAVVQGDYGGEVPALTRTSDIYELCLARISVAAGTTQITALMIIDTRADETVCGIVAGAVTQLSTGELLNQLKAGFEEWFHGIKGQLSEDAAGNLQNQINDRVKIADKATDEEAIAGTDDIKYVTPAKAKLSSSKFRLLASYTVAGSVSFQVPAGVTKILALMIGGGGSGGACAYSPGNSGYYVGATGGTSGAVNKFLKAVTPGDIITGVVGAGGAAVSLAVSGGRTSGNGGGTTSFGSMTALGGAGGISNYTSTYSEIVGASRDQAQRSRHASPSNTSTTPHGFEFVKVSTAAYKQEYYWAEDPIFLVRLFQAQNGKEPLTHVAAGGYAMAQYAGASSTTYLEQAAGFINTKASTPAISIGAGVAAVALKGTDPGCGGSAAVSYSGIATSAAGCDGGIFVYEVLE